MLPVEGHHHVHAELEHIKCFLKGKRHCRASWRNSDCTDKVVSAARACKDAGGDVAAITFLGLQYFVANSRDMIQHWQQLAQCSPANVPLQPIRDALGGAYTVSSRTFPVSAATGSKLGLPPGSQKEQTVHKHVQLGRLWISKLVRAFERDASIMMDWRRLTQLLGCSELQAFMLVRVWCAAFGGRRHIPEVWLAYSRSYVPEPFRARGPASLGLAIRDLAAASPAAAKIAARWRELFGEPFDDSHVEHVGCELRKALDDLYGHSCAPARP